MGQLNADVIIGGNRENVRFDDSFDEMQEAGFTFGGEITPSSEPSDTQKQLFFMAKTPGTYTHYGNLSFAEGEVGYVYKDNGTWKKDSWCIGDLLDSEADNATGKMGYKVLKPGSSFASQVTDTDTVYEIRDVFDLNSGQVTIPDDCTLRFNGGVLKNGTLVIQDNFSIESDDYKIFYGMSFTGKLQNLFFHIDWFVENSCDRIDADAPDATSELQGMFDSGIKAVWFTQNRSYRITDTLVVGSDILIDGNEQRKMYSYENNTKYIFGSMEKPLVRVVARYANNWGVKINNLYLRREQTETPISSSNYYKKDISTLVIDTTDGLIWGIDIRAFLSVSKATATYYAGDGTTTLSSSMIGGYRGLELYSNGNELDFVRISGSIDNFYEGVYLHRNSTSGSNIGGIVLDFDSSGLYGGRICQKASISGNHQTRALLPSTNEDAYFEVDDIADVSRCYVVDTGYTAAGSDTTFTSCRYSVRAPRFSGQDSLFDVDSKNKSEITGNLTPSLLGKANLGGNLIPRAFYGTKFFDKHFGYIRDIKYISFQSDSDYNSYTQGSTSVGTPLNESTVNNFEYLFYPDKYVLDNVSSTVSAYINKTSLKNNEATKVLYFECKLNYLSRATIVFYQNSSIIESVSIDNGATTKTFSASDGERYFYYNQPIYVPCADANTATIKVVVTYRTATANIDFPYIGICGMSDSSVGEWGGNIAGLLKCRNVICTNTPDSYGGVASKVYSHPVLFNYSGSGGTSTSKLLHLVSESTGTWYYVSIKCMGSVVNVCAVPGSDYLFLTGTLWDANAVVNVYKKSNNKEIIIEASRIFNASIESIETSYTTIIADIPDTMDGFSLMSVSRDLCSSASEHSVTKTGVDSNITVSDGGVSSVVGNRTYMATLVPASGYSVGSVTITMGGTDITSFVYNETTHVIYIAAVTGNIVITATAAS